MESMILGTAGFTAAYAVLKIRNGNIEPDGLPVVVTGATGGVGSMAVAMLSQLGYRVVAVSGKEDQYKYLRNLGAFEVAGRDMVTDRSNKQLLGSTWSAAVETTGGEILDTVIRQTAHNGVVTCCGNVLGHMLKTSIYPFILRGVSLMGVDSGICLMPKRIEIWNKVSAEWKLEALDQMYREVTLEQLGEEIDLILEGSQTGRVIIKLLD
jgi:acrylyl-CoA reductase (NADPH)